MKFLAAAFSLVFATASHAAFNPPKFEPCGSINPTFGTCSAKATRAPVKFGTKSLSGTEQCKIACVGNCTAKDSKAIEKGIDPCDKYKDRDVCSSHKEALKSVCVWHSAAGDCVAHTKRPQSRACPSFKMKDQCEKQKDFCQWMPGPDMFPPPPESSKVKKGPALKNIETNSQTKSKKVH